MKKARLNQIEITPAGHVQIRMQKFVEVNGEIIDMGWHRTIVEVDGDVDAQMSAVNAHLAQMGFAAVPASEIAQIKAHFNLAATPERIAAHKEVKRRSIEEMSGKSVADKPSKIN